jgi:hypothetical protein
MFNDLITIFASIGFIVTIRWLIPQIYWLRTRDPNGDMPGYGHIDDNERIIGPDKKILSKLKRSME